MSRSARPRPLGRLGALGRGLAGLTGLVALLVGVPVALVRAVGWPLPTTWPDPGPVLDTLRNGGVQPDTLAKVLACLVWVAWLPLAVALGRELATRAGAARRWPVHATGPLQRLAAGTVAWTSLLTAVVGSSRPAVAAPLADALAPLGRAPVAVAVVAPGPAPARSATPSPPAAATTYVVRPRDTLWGIAERLLDSGERWPELTRLNTGRTVAPGIVFTDATERLRPGWQLLVPASPSTPAAAGVAAAPPGQADEEVEVAPGDTLWALAERLYGEPRAWPVLWEANRGRHFGDRVFDDPGRIHPGWRLAVPGPAAEAPDAPVTTPPPGPVAAVPAQPTPPPPPPSPPRTVDDTPAPPAPAVVTALPCPALPDPVEPPATLPPAEAEDLASGPALGVPTGAAAVLVATGAAAAIATRRRRRARRAPPGHRLPAPDPDLMAVRAAIAAGDRPVVLARLDVALRNLAAHLARRPPGRARVLAVVLGDDGRLEVAVDGAVPVAPHPWRPGPSADRLVLDADVTLASLAVDVAGVAHPCPALVHLGRGDDGDVLVDLEAIGVLGLGGGSEAGSAVARALLAGLAVSPLTDVLDVVACGVEPWGLTSTRVRSAAAADLPAVAVAAVEPLRRALAATGAASAFALRADGGDEPWEPTVVVAAGLDAATVDGLRALATGSGLGLAAVGIAAPWSLDPVPGGRWRLTPLGLDLTPARLGPDDLADLGAVLGDADRPAEPAPAPEVPPCPAPGVRAPLVRVLGPVDVVDADGTPVSFERAKALELVAWLALHRSRPLRREARAALWTVEVADGTFHNVASEARKALARAVPTPAGEEWLPRTQDPTFALHPAVGTDLDRFRILVRAGRGAEALALVRGAPFAGASWWWLDAETHALDATLEVVDVVGDVAEAHGAAGRNEQVFTTTALGLQLLPGHERLVELRLRAHAASGNRAGLRREFEAYERVVAAEGSDPSAALVALRAELARGLG